MAQSHTAGSCEAEIRRVGPESCSSAEPAHRAARTEIWNGQAPALAEIVEPIASVGFLQRNPDTALREAIFRVSLIQAGALGKNFALNAFSPTIAHIEATLRIALIPTAALGETFTGNAFIKTWNVQAVACAAEQTASILKVSGGRAGTPGSPLATRLRNHGQSGGAA